MNKQKQHELPFIVMKEVTSIAGIIYVISDKIRIITFEIIPKFETEKFT